MKTTFPGIIKSALGMESVNLEFAIFDINELTRLNPILSFPNLTSAGGSFFIRSNMNNSNSHRTARAVFVGAIFVP